MKRLFLFISFALLCIISIAQFPQGINYQAVARNGETPITIPFPVRITIQSDSLGGSLYWVEEHSSVIPNSSGLFSLVVGTGKKISGVTAFSDIDWAVGTKYIKAEINYNGWLTMGASRIWSVPYSMVANKIGGTLDKLDVQGKTTSMEEALFEVRNKDGQTVFAVYNEGVRINVADGDPNTKGAKGGFAIGGFDLTKGTSHDLFVVSSDSIRAYIYDDPALKGAKGGFAIGGFDLTKGTTNDYLLISHDSARIYVDNSPSTKGAKGGFAIGGFDLTKGINQKFMTVSNDSIRMYIDDSGKGAKGGFAIGGFDLNKGERSNFLNVATDETGIIDPSQNRILWYPIKNAFLAGKVRIGTPDSVGENSMAIGYESKARGMYSQAMGFKSIANGDYSTSIGKNAVSNYDNSFAFGENALADNIQTYAFGKGTLANALGSFAFGYNAKATGKDAFAFGSGTESNGQGSFGIGFIGRDSAGISTGNTRADADWSVAIGMGSQAMSRGAFSVGTQTMANADYSFAMGYKTEANSYTALAMGYKTIASNPYSTAMGFETLASGYYSTAMGQKSVASGTFATAMGHTTASGSGSTSMGIFTKASGIYSTAMGQSTIASGQSSTAMGFMSRAEGNYSVAMGSGAIAKSMMSVVIGIGNDTTCSVNGDKYWYYLDPLFIIGNGSGLTPSNAFTVLKNGYTAVGHAAPSQMLDVNGNARFRSVSSGTYYAPLNITSNGTLTISSSDISIKKEIIPITEALSKVLEMKGVYFSWKDDDQNTRRIGFIAQEMEDVMPEVVFTNPADGLKGINYSELSSVVVEAIKEQQKQIETYKAENSDLKSQLQTLQEKVERIELLLKAGDL